MPVGAAIGVGVLGAGASVVGASKNSKAINKATDAQTAGNDRAIAAQEKARTENLALQRPIYDAGLPAMATRNALLGLTMQQPAATPPAATLPTPQPNALAQLRGGPGVADYYGAGDGSIFTDGYGALSGALRNDMYPMTGINALLAREGQFPGPVSGFGGGTFNFNTTQATPTQQQAGYPAITQQSARDAFDTFRNSTGYQFRLNEGLGALNSGWAGAGTLQSGAAGKSFIDYGQNYASGEFGNFWNMLGEQQNLTSGAANAMSGVNTTYANNAGNLAVANGNAQANAAVAKANNSNALLGGIFGSIGSGVGILQGAGKL